MCFHISIINNHNSIEEEMNAKFVNEENFNPNLHISAFSNPLIPVIISKNIQEINLFNWGLIPHWAKDTNQANRIRRMTYNAKSETVNQKPSFKFSIKNKKCLIIANGFYEWQATNKGKICYYITSSDSNIIAFAGIWSIWINRSNGESVKSASILTQRANKTMSFIHNIKKRQPVVLNKIHRNLWLNSQHNFSNILNSSYDTNFNYRIVKSPLKN
tara:strand:- start:4163 stop:4810 length:648 start_codon:yes stop_codon:yes gene_type:complete